MASQRRSQNRPQVYRWAVSLTALILVGAMVATVGSASLAGAAVKPATITASLSVTVGPPTTTTVLTASGLPDSKSVTIDFDTTQLLMATTNSSGQLPATTIFVPALATPGLHAIKLVTTAPATSTSLDFTVRTDWSQARYSPVRAGTNPYEDTLGLETAGGLAKAWSFTAGATPGNAISSSPAVDGGLVYFGSLGSASPQAFGSVYAVNATTGAKVWSFTTNSVVDSSPAVVNGVVYVGSDKLYALDATTGAKKWSFAPSDVEFDTSPAVVGNTVYIGTEFDVFAVNATTGAQIWRNDSVFPQERSSVAVLNGLVYVGTGSDTVVAMDTTTGAVQWTFNVPCATSCHVESSPAVANGAVYVGDDNGSVYALNGTTGAKLWSTQVSSDNEVVSSPAVVDGVVYVGSNDDKVYALDQSSGAVLWSFNTGGQVESSPAVVNGVVYVGTNKLATNFYALDAATGTELFSFTDADMQPVESSPAVANGVVYFGGDDDALYALKSKSTPHASNQNASFIEAAYADFLGAAPTVEQLAFAAGLLDDGSAGPSQAVEALADSNAYVSAVVNKLYVNTLGHVGDPTGVAFWTNKILSGAETIAEVASNFYASDEYFNGIGGGTNTSWVTDLYHKLLDRAPDSGGLAYWVGQVTATSRFSVAYRFFQSTESCQARVTALYQEFLDRAPDPAGLTYWAGQVAEHGDLVLAVDLASSTEYYNDAQTRFP